MRTFVGLLTIAMAVLSAGPAAASVAIPGPDLPASESGWNKFGLLLHADASVTLESVRYVNAGGASTIVLQEGLDGAVLASIPVLAGNPDATVVVDVPLSAGIDYAIYANESVGNSKYANYSDFPVGVAGITVVASIGCGLAPGCSFDSPRTDFWAAFRDITTSSDCGNGSIDGGEQCDHGAYPPICCSSTCHNQNESAACDNGIYCIVGAQCVLGTCTGVPTEPIPESSCIAGSKAKFQLTDNGGAGKDKLSWRIGGGAAVSQAELGTPTVDDQYALCIYDSTASVSDLVYSIRVDPSGNRWVLKDPKGLRYGEPAGVMGGVRKIRIRTGADGETSARLTAGGLSLVLPDPAGAEFFDQDESVIVQLVNSDGTCWSTTFTAADTSSNVPAQFEAAFK